MATPFWIKLIPVKSFRKKLNRSREKRSFGNVLELKWHLAVILVILMLCRLMAVYFRIRSGL